MKKFSFLLLMLFSISCFSGESIISLEVSELFENLGYDKNEIVQLKTGDFGEGGGGNRPIKAIHSDIFLEDGLVYYYPIDYQINFHQASKKLLKKIPLNAIRVFNIIGNNTTIAYSIEEIHSFDLEFSDIVDLNNISAKNISAIILENGNLYFPSDIESIEIEAIIEP